MPDGSFDSGAKAAPDFLDRLPPHIAGSLTVEQKAAIAAAAGQREWNTHPVNIRLTLPLLPRKWFLTIVGGPERRASGRRQSERRRHPLRTAGNFTFILVAAIALYGVAAAILLFSSTVFEY